MAAKSIMIKKLSRASDTESFVRLINRYVEKCFEWKKRFITEFCGMVRRKLRWCHRAERSAVRGERHRKTQAVRRKRQRTDTAGRCGHRPLRIGICRGGIQQNCELKASPGGSCHGAAVTDEGKRSLQMQPTAEINQKGLPSSDLASLGHLPPREGLWPAS